MIVNKKDFLASIAPVITIATRNHVVPAAGAILFRQSTKEKGVGVAIVNSGTHVVAARFSTDDYFIENIVDGATFAAAMAAAPEGQIKFESNGKEIRAKSGTGFAVKFPIISDGPTLPTAMPAGQVTLPVDMWPNIHLAAKFAHQEELSAWHAVYLMPGAIVATDTTAFILIKADQSSNMAIQKGQVAHLPADEYLLAQEDNGALWFKSASLTGMSAYTGQFVSDRNAAIFNKMAAMAANAAEDRRQMTADEIRILSGAAKTCGAGDSVRVDNGKIATINSITGMSVSCETEIKGTITLSPSLSSRCLSAIKGDKVFISLLKNGNGFTVIFSDEDANIFSGMQSYMNQ